MEIRNYKRTVIEGGEPVEEEVQVATYTGPEDEAEMNDILDEGHMDGTNYIGRKRCFRKGWSFILPKAQEKPKVFRLVKDVVNVYDLTEDEDETTPVFISVDFKGNKKGYVYKATENDIDLSALVEVLEEGCEATLEFSTDKSEEGWTISGTKLTFAEGSSKTGSVTVEATLGDTTKTATMKVKMSDELYNLINPPVLNVQVTKLPAANSPKDNNEEDCKFNQDAVTVSQSDNTVTVSGDLSTLKTYTSTNPSQGDGKWVGLIVNTQYGYDAADIYYGDEKLPDSEFTDAQGLGIDSVSSIILWIKAEVVAENAKVITLEAKEKGGETVIGAKDTITINFVNTAA